MNGECQKKNRRRRRREKKENEKKTPKRRTLPSSSRHANEASVTGPQPAVFTELLPGFTEFYRISTFLSNKLESGSTG